MTAAREQLQDWGRSGELWDLRCPYDGRWAEAKAAGGFGLPLPWWARLIPGCRRRRTWPPRER